jgi:hypothetical protein
MLIHLHRTTWLCMFAIKSKSVMTVRLPRQSMTESSAKERSAVQIKLSEVIGALSCALDITEGQPKGGSKAARAIIELRCDRGAKIARELEFPELTATAIRSLDEHYTHQILSRVQGFKGLADLAAHHLQLDGKGYHRGWDASQWSKSARILAVAEIYEALTAKRSYRQHPTDEEVTTIMHHAQETGMASARRCTTRRESISSAPVLYRRSWRREPPSRPVLAKIFHNVPSKSI